MPATAFLPAVLLPLLIAVTAAANEPVDYLRDVKPILAQHCYACHGALRQQGGLRVDTANLIVQGGDSGSAITAGKSAESLIMARVTGEESPRMPLEAHPLSESQVAVLKAWIDEGAVAPPDEIPQPDPRLHWAYQPPQRASVPVVQNTAWVRNPIDSFLGAEHERLGLVPRPEADRATLLRRVYLDLIGLPPTRDQLNAFLADPSPLAYENVVDELLSSPRYGERWGRHWMDVWRYSDWYGSRSINELRNSRRNIWRWRDWTVRSLNDDKPYDRMVAEMIAADELSPGDLDALPATGFLARNYFAFNRNVWLQDTAEYTAAAFLGITLKCCRCHDHKYDPISHDDYYRFRAFFEPYDVRTEQIPGKPERIAERRGAATINAFKEGFERVYDAHPDVPTYRFERGNEMNPDKEHPLQPGVPEVFSGFGPIEPVQLPLEVYYPDLRPFVEAEMQAAANAALAAASAERDKAQAQLAAAQRAATEAGQAVDNTPAVLQARLALELAEKVVATAQANLAALAARFAADRARHATPPSADANLLAIAASKAERTAAVCRSEEEVARAQVQVAAAQAALRPEEEPTKTALANADQSLSAAEKKLAEGQAALAAESDQYAPIGTVYHQTSTGRRLALARWMTSRENPLTARVAVNQIWMRHFGSPLVPTVANFGLNGKPPTHPALLDWLAVEFMERGWRMKSLHRLIVTSSAYRMESADLGSADPNRALDAENRYLWRMNPRRMESETVRDSLLHLAGELDTAMGGQEIDPTTAERTTRRSIYFAHAPDWKPGLLETFDAPDPAECFRRQENVTPQQALALLNSQDSARQSRLLAATLSQLAGSEIGPATDEAFISLAFEQVLSRRPESNEREACARFLQRQGELLRQPEKLTAHAGGPGIEPKPAADPRQRARENLVHALFNSHEFINVR